MLNLKVIIGSTRAGRAADIVTPWIVDHARQHGAFEVDVLDLRDWPLPIFAETLQTVGDFANPTYSEPIVKQWNQRIREGEAFLFITPEYNHSIPGVLKNAIDNVFVSFAFRNKPSAFVGYSGGLAAGVRAIEHLADVVLEAEMVPLRNTVLIPQVQFAFEGAKPRDPLADVSLAILLDDLAWWGSTLQQARVNGELPPGSIRLRAALEPAKV
jgi:NAD(P)H-dependent FMN reductase